MKRPNIRAKHGPEYGIQNDLVRFLQARGWHIERIIGNALQHGLPDLYAGHPSFGQRWVEVKNESRYDFTRAQKHKFPILDHFGIGIWVLVAATDTEYDKLFGPPNWRDYWKTRYGAIDIDELLDELE